MKMADSQATKEAAPGFEIKTIRTAKCQVCAMKIKTSAQQCKACRWLICEGCETARGSVQHTCYLGALNIGHGHGSSTLARTDLPTYEHKQPQRLPKKRARRSSIDSPSSRRTTPTNVSRITKAESAVMTRNFEELPYMSIHDGLAGVMFRPEVEFPELPSFQFLCLVDAHATYQVRLMRGFGAQIIDSSLSIYRDAFHPEEQAEEVFSFECHKEGVNG
jgi:hypothetical protein